MNDSMRPDRNLCSIVGYVIDPDGSKRRGPFISVDGQQPHPWDGKELPDLSVGDPATYASTLKVCDEAAADLAGVTIRSGAEGSVDVANRGHLVLRNSLIGSCTGKRSVSVKGGSYFEMDHGAMQGGGLVLVDEWDDFCTDPSEVKLLEDPRIRIIKRLGASKVSGGKVDWFRSFTHTVYWWFKWTARKVQRIPLGVKGPKWLPLVLCALLVSGTGCAYLGRHNPWKGKPTAKPTASAATVNPMVSAGNATDLATGKVDLATTKQVEKLQEIAGQVRANVDQIRDVNSTTADSPAKTVIDMEAEIAQGRLADTPPNAAEQAASAQRRALIEAGKAEEARAAKDTALAQAATALAEKSALSKQLEDAIRERDAARAIEEKQRTQFLEKLEANRLANQSAMDALRNEETAKQQMILRGVALVCLLIFGLGAGFGQLAGAKLTAPFAVFSLLLFGLAQLIAEAWFRYAAGGVCLLGLGAIGWWLYHLHGKERVTEAADVFIPQLDIAYDNAPQPVKDYLDQALFTPLGDKMDANVKLAVAKIQAQSLIKKAQVKAAT